MLRAAHKQVKLVAALLPDGVKTFHRNVSKVVASRRSPR
jgi:hypothetical protein